MNRIIYTLLLFFFTNAVRTQESITRYHDDLQVLQLERYPDLKLFALQLNEHESKIDEFYDPVKRSIVSDQLFEDRSIHFLLEEYPLLTDLKASNLHLARIVNYYFAENELDKMIAWSTQINAKYLSQEYKDDINFKTGYALLVNKQFEEAKSYFDQGNDKYYIHNIYYGSMTEYYMGNTLAAANGFEQVDEFWPYNEYVPYYLTQIYFSNKAFDKVIAYGNQSLQSESLQNKAEMNKLVGLAYFELGDYRAANDKLTEYAISADKLTKEEFYQIAYTQYQMKDDENSIATFKELSNLSDSLGTLANYYIAEMYLRSNDQKAAQTAFSKLAKTSVIQSLKKDAEYNFALISVELGDQRPAINTIKSFDQSHPHYEEGQQLLIQVLKSSEDYAAAMGYIEDLEYKSPEILEVYQELAYKQAVLNFNNNTPLQSLSYFSIAASTPGMSQLSAEAIFWQAYIHYQKGNLLRSQGFLDDYFEFAKKNSAVIVHESYPKSNYLQAYILWDKSQYAQSEGYFTTAINVKGPWDAKQRADAYTRIGDIGLLRNDYRAANQSYLKGLELNLNNDYAAYQLGVIAGLQKSDLDRILIFEEFIENFPKSDYRDDALFKTGNSYQALGQNNKALIAYNTILEDYGLKSELTIQALLKKGLISYNTGNVENAINAYRKVFELSPTAEEKKQALLALEEIYIQELNDPQSYFDIAENQGGLNLDGFEKDSISYFAAQERFKNSEYENAIKALKQYRKNYTNGFYKDASFYYEAESYAILEKYDDALTVLQELIQNENSKYKSESLLKLALIHYNHKANYNQAFKYFDAYYDLTKDVKITQINATLHSASEIANKRGIEKYADLVINATDSTNEQKALAHFYIGSQSKTDGHYDQAIKSLSEVMHLANNKKAAEASFLLSEIYYDQSQLELAENQALETTNRSSQYPRLVAKSLLLLGDIYLKMKDPYNARAAIEATIENYKEDKDLIEIAARKLKKVELLEKEMNRIKEEESSDQIKLDTIYK